MSAPILPIGHPDLDYHDCGWRPNQEHVDRFTDSLERGPVVARAVPTWMGDGLSGDLMPYQAWYEIECKSDDGSVWKPKGEEPPYIPQVGNNCTSRGLADGLDLLQAMRIADDQHERPDSGETIVFHRVAVEATYAFGLHCAGMRGDGGCSGGGMAQGAKDIGCVTYKHIGTPYEENRDRLHAYANNPGSVVQRFSKDASAFRPEYIGLVRTWEEVCAIIANKGVVTVASSVGYNSPRNEQGICEARGRWEHQMVIVGIIRSDGVETAVILQSWGPNNPRGPQPFKLPSFAFRARRQAVEAQLSAQDSYGFRAFPGFEKAPLPRRYTNLGWGR